MKTSSILYDKAEEIRNIIKEKLPDGSIVAEHTPTEHFYRCNIFDGAPLYNSVTTKTSVISEGYLKGWAVNTAINHIRNNQNRLTTDFEQVLAEAKEQHKDIFTQAGDLGTEVHDAVENYINDWIKKREQPENIRDYIDDYADPRVMSGVLAAEKFFQDNMIIPIWSELLVGSEKLQVAGTLDFLALVGKVIKPAKKEGEREYYQVKLTAKDGVYLECINTGERIKYELSIIDWKTSNSIDKPHYVLQVSTYSKCFSELININPKRHIVVRLDKQTANYDSVELEPDQVRKAIKSYKLGINVLYEFLNSNEAKLVIKKQRNILQV